jgi:hypothetical protein
MGEPTLSLVSAGKMTRPTPVFHLKYRTGATAKWNRFADLIERAEKCEVAGYTQRPDFAIYARAVELVITVGPPASPSPRE